MKSFFSWFTNKAKLKRWYILLLMGIALVCYGVSKLLYSDTLDQYRIVKIVCAFAFGVLFIITSMVFIQKRLLELLVEKTDTRNNRNKADVSKLIFNKRVYNQGPKVVVIGGGHGLNTVLKGLKHYTDNITAIVTLSDYGETPTDSKKQLKVLPIDDIKESLIALSYNENEMEDLLNTRFTEGKLSNLDFADIYFLAMNKLHGNFAESIENSKNIYNITGRVLPVTLDPIKICAELSDGTTIENREKIPELVSESTGKITRVFISPSNAKPATGVLEAIKNADAIVIGPGSLYTNVIPNLLVKGIAHEIRESKALKIYVSNIMTEVGETDEYTLSDHLKAIVDYVGEKIIDYCIYDTGEIIPEFIQKYNEEGRDIVLADTTKCKELGVKLVQRNLSRIEGDSIRHDSDIIALTIIQLICDELKFNDMQNDPQFLMLNNKMKESKRAIRKRLKKERKFQESGRSQYERSNTRSKFNEKYDSRISSIKNSDESRINNIKNEQMKENAKLADEQYKRENQEEIFNDSEEMDNINHSYSNFIRDNDDDNN